MSFLSEAVDLIDELVAYEDESTAGAVSVVGLSPMSALVEKLSLREHVERGGLEGAQLKEFFHTYLQATARLHHPGSLAHQVAVPHHSGALAALLGGFTNNPMAIFEMGPAAATIEYFVVNWLLEKVGWTTAPYCRNADSMIAHGGGVFTHGGSEQHPLLQVPGLGRVPTEGPRSAPSRRVIPPVYGYLRTQTRLCGWRCSAEAS